MKTVEVRCPAGPKRLFSKLRFTGGEIHYTEDNLLEFACADCKRTLRKTDPTIERVLHQYDFLGTLIRTYIS